MLLSYEYLDVFVGVLKTIRRENGGETYEKQCDIFVLFTNETGAFESMSLSSFNEGYSVRLF